MAIKFKRLADLRIDNDLLQKDVAKILKVNHNTYPHWESGLYDIPMEQIDKLSLLYNVSVDYITGLSNVKGNYGKKFNYMLVGKRLRETRKLNNLSQEMLKDIIDGFDQMNVSRYERNVTPIPFSKLYLFAYKFDVSIDYLMGKTDINIIHQEIKKEIPS